MTHERGTVRRGLSVERVCDCTAVRHAPAMPWAACT